MEFCVANTLPVSMFMAKKRIYISEHPTCPPKTPEALVPQEDENLWPLRWMAQWSRKCTTTGTGFLVPVNEVMMMTNSNKLKHLKNAQKHLPTKHNNTRSTSLIPVLGHLTSRLAPLKPGNNEAPPILLSFQYRAESQEHLPNPPHCQLNGPKNLQMISRLPIFFYT